MQKFTIFSVILSVIVVVVVLQIVADDYLGNENLANPLDSKELTYVLPENLQANVLGKTISTTVAEEASSFETPELTDSKIIYSSDTTSETVNTDSKTESAINDADLLQMETTGSDFEDLGFVSSTPNVYIREEQVKSAGFANSGIKEEEYNGYYFKTIYVDNIPGLTVKRYAIEDSVRLYAKIYVLTGENLKMSDLYKSLQARCSNGLNSEINSTNQYGLASFYMNDTSRADVAFLTVRFTGVIYGFSYPKEYHVQVKNLIKLISLEH